MWAAAAEAMQAALSADPAASGDHLARAGFAAFHGHEATPGRFVQDGQWRRAARAVRAAAT